VASVDEFVREEQTIWFVSEEVITEFIRSAMPAVEFGHDETQTNFVHPAVDRTFVREECDDGP
jgi:hypothetical protein